MKDYFSIPLSDGTCVKSYSMDEEEFISLIANADILTMEWDLYIFILKNGNVIVDFDHKSARGVGYHRYGWYNSFEDLKKVQEDQSTKEEPHPFFDDDDRYDGDLHRKMQGIIDASAEGLSLEDAYVIAKNMKNYFLLQLSDGSYIKRYSMNKEEFDSLSVDADKYMTKWGSNIFILKNGNAIIDFAYTSNKGTVYHYYGWYKSFEDFEKVQIDHPNRKESHHFFEGYNPYNGDFSKKTRELVDTLMKDLSLDHENIVLNGDLIRRVDKEIMRQEDPQIFMITHLLNIVALVGEVFLAENDNAEWYIKGDGDTRNETWMPEIKMHQSEEKTGTISFVKWLYEPMMNYEGNFDVVESAYLSLNDFKRLGLLTEER
jgi:hypothetical protein